MSSSYLQKFIFESLPVKGSLVVLDDARLTIAEQKIYPNGFKSNYWVNYWQQMFY